MTDSGDNSNMGDLIPIHERDLFGKGVIQCVDARDIHGFLKVGTRYTQWIRARIAKYGFVEGVDFVSFSESSEKLQGGRSTDEYFVSLAMGKELGMVEPGGKGGEIRRYFIEKEQAYHVLVEAQSRSIQPYRDPVMMIKTGLDQISNRMEAMADEIADRTKERDEARDSNSELEGENARLAGILAEVTRTVENMRDDTKKNADIQYAKYKKLTKTASDLKAVSSKDDLFAGKRTSLTLVRRNDKEDEAS